MHIMIQFVYDQTEHTTLKKCLQLTENNNLDLRKVLDCFASRLHRDGLATTNRMDVCLRRNDKE